MSTSKKRPGSTPEKADAPDEKPAARDWTSLGKHRYHVDGDILRLELCGGEITLPDAEQLIQALEALQGRHGYYLLLASMGQGLEITPAVRRRIANWSTGHRAKSATACIGAGTAARALVTLALQALRLLGRGAHRIEFFADLEAGRSWLIGQREELTRSSS